MNKKIFILFLIITTSILGSAMPNKPKQKDKNKQKEKAAKAAETKPADTKTKEAKIVDVKEAEKIAIAKVDSLKNKLNIITTQTDSLELFLANSKLKFLKKNAHASYYHNRFNGRRTASGKKFDNNGYTAAHKKLPFGTKVKVTNEANGKFVIVEITDRGPFSKAREIDLSRKAFMDIVSNKNSGMVLVTIEVIEPKK